MLPTEKAQQAELRRYAVQQALANAEFIAPELMDFATIGDSAEAIDQSIARAKLKSQQIAQRALAGQVRPSDQDDPGPMFTSAVREGISDQQIPDVSQMSMEEYAAARAQLGLERPKDQGIFAGVRKG